LKPHGLPPASLRDGEQLDRHGSGTPLLPGPGRARKNAQLLKTLTPREEKVIKMRFGLDDGSEHTLEEVGQSFAVT